MNLSGAAPVGNAGISVRIVDWLGKFEGDVPIDFLAQQVGQRPENLMADLEQLANRGIVKIDTARGTVGLAGEREKSILGGFFKALSGIK